MNFYVLTLFPDTINNTVNHSIIKRAIENNILSVNSFDIRKFANNKHNNVDDYPYGGGAGMVLQPDPIFSAYNHVKSIINKPVRVVYLTPHGTPFNQAKAQEFSKEENLIFLCGHYEGIDQRVIDEIVTDEVSLGDYILTGGELPTLVVIDSVSRLIKGVLGKEESHMEESFSDGLLEHPHYTRPAVFNNIAVPEVLLSGHHANIIKWRREQSLLTTSKKRPDLLKSYSLTKDDLKTLSNLNITL